MTFTPKKNPRFVWCIGAVDDCYPDIPQSILNTTGVHLWDRQEGKVVMTLSPDYANAFCLETTAPDGHPFTLAETWFNSASKTALESENIPGTK